MRVLSQWVLLEQLLLPGHAFLNGWFSCMYLDGHLPADGREQLSRSEKTTISDKKFT